MLENLVRVGCAHYPSSVFSWRSLPLGKVPKTIRKGHLWRLPSGISRQRKNVTESRVSLTENRHWRQKLSGKIYSVGFQSVVREDFPWQPRNVRDTFSFSRRSENCQRNFKLSLSVQHRQGWNNFPVGSPTVSHEINFPVSVQPSGKIFPVIWLAKSLII